MEKISIKQGHIPPIKFENTLTGQKEVFEPINPPFVGIYVCGPTVYSIPHIGNARPAVVFDTLKRYLTYQGYKVRYVSNITDVGHLSNDSDDGEDKIAKKAKLEKLEPMEIVNQYTNIYVDLMDKLNVLRPDIRPTATGHIIEQIELVEKILKNGFAYEVNGSVYFDVQKYNQTDNYGELSGKVLEDLQANTRALDGQQEKRFSADFALWKKASPEHIMRWNSPWGEGFPGWHLECTVMSSKYLGDTFDIHGGGMDLKFPHHECEIAQAKAANQKQPVKYWLHNNMLTINGGKMGKSLGNFILLTELFDGSHELLEQAYSPMTVKVFILQAHYRGVLDFTNKGLKDAQKLYIKLMNALRVLKKLEYPIANTSNSVDEKLDKQIVGFCDNAFRGMNDDMNTAKVLAQLSNILKKINAFYLGQLAIEHISLETFDYMKKTYIDFIENIFGLIEEKNINENSLIEGFLEFYKEFKANKEYDKVDKIRDYFKKSGLLIKDMKDRIDWAYEE